MATPEGRVKEAVKRVLRARRIWFYMPVQNGLGYVGIPDFVCCWNGRMLAIETKAPGKRAQTTANQERVLADIQGHGGLSIVVDDAAQLTQFLDEAEASHDQSPEQSEAGVR